MSGDWSTELDRWIIGRIAEEAKCMCNRCARCSEPHLSQLVRFLSGNSLIETRRVWRLCNGDDYARRYLVRTPPISWV